MIRFFRSFCFISMCFQSLYAVETSDAVETNDDIELPLLADDQLIPRYRKYFAGLETTEEKLEGLSIIDPDYYIKRVPDMLIPELLDRFIKDPDITVRVRAARAFVQTDLAPKYRVELTDLLKVEDLELKKMIIYVMGFGGDLRFFAPKLVALLKHHDPGIRQQACRAFSHRDEVLAARYHHEIASLLNDPDLNVVSCAMSTLSHLQARASLPKVFPFLEHKNPGIRESATDAVALLDKQHAAQYIVSRLQDSHSSVRANAARRLGDIGAKEHLNDIATLLAESDLNPRQAALEAIQALGDESHVPLVLPLLEDPEYRCRQKAIVAVTELGKEKFAAHIAARLQDTEPEIRYYAAWHLGLLNATAYLDDIAKQLNDPVTRPRVAAIAAIESLGNEKHIALIKPLLHDPDPQCRARAVQAIAFLGNTPFAHLMAPLLNDEQSNVRVSAMRHLAFVGARQYISEIAKLLTVERDDERQVVIEALGSLGNFSHIALIEPYLQDRNAQCREAAKRAIQIIKSKFS